MHIYTSPSSRIPSPYTTGILHVGTYGSKASLVSISDRCARPSESRASITRSCLQGKQFLITHNETLISTFTFHFRICHPIMLWVSVCSILNCKEFRNIQFLATSPYYNPTTYFLNCIISYNRRHLQLISKIDTRLALQLVFTMVMAKAMAMFLAWAVFKARKHLEP